MKKETLFLEPLKNSNGSTLKKTNARLDGSRLRVARLIWGIIALACLVIFFASIPAYLTVLQQICSGEAATVNICNTNNQLLQANVQTLAHSHISLGAYATIVVIIDIVSSLTFMLTGALIFWRKSNERFSLFVSLVLILFGALGPFALNRAVMLITQYPTWQVALPVGLLQASIYPALGLFLYLFPTGHLVPRWSWVFLFAWIAQDIFFLLPVSSPYSIQNISPVLRLTIFLLAYGSALGCQIYRYRRVSRPVQRQQTKWLIVGFAGTVVLKILITLVPVDPQTLSTLFLLIGVLIGYIYLLPLPLAIGIALLRYRLWDIDTIINRALVYSVLTAMLAAVSIGLIIALQSLLSRLTGQASPIAIVASTLVIAALFQPLRRRVQAIIDRRFYRRKYNAVRTVAAFSTTLRNEVDLSQLSEHLVALVEETMQPTQVSLWVRTPPQVEKYKAWLSNPSSPPGEE